jgi:hypothetical protein
MAGSFLWRDGAFVQELLHQRVVACDLLNAAIADQVGTAIAYLGYVCELTSDGCCYDDDANLDEFGALLSIGEQICVGGLKGFSQPQAEIGLIAVEIGAHDFLSSVAADQLASLTTTQATGDDVKAAGVICLSWISGLIDQNAIFPLNRDLAGIYYWPDLRS